MEERQVVRCSHWPIQVLPQQYLTLEKMPDTDGKVKSNVHHVIGGKMDVNAIPSKVKVVCQDGRKNCGLSPTLPRTLHMKYSNGVYPFRRNAQRGEVAAI
jgi:hypothetical protein